MALKLGVHPARLEQGLLLLREAPASVTTVEQAHASGAVLVREHCLYDESTLVDRATLHSSRSLFMPDACELALGRLSKELERLGAKQPEKISARNMFVRHCAQQRHVKGCGGETSSFQHMQSVMTAHANDWAALSRDDRRRFHIAAGRRRALVLQQIAERRDEIKQEMSEIRADTEGNFRALGVPNHFAACRFSQEELDAFASKLQGYKNIVNVPSGLTSQSFGLLCGGGSASKVGHNERGAMHNLWGGIMETNLLSQCMCEPRRCWIVRGHSFLDQPGI